MTDEDIERLMQFEGIVKTVWKSNRQSRMRNYSLPYKRNSAVFIIIPCHSFPTKSRLSTHSGHWARFRYPLPNPMPWVKIWKTRFQVLRDYNLLRPFASFRFYQRSSDRLYLPESSTIEFLKSAATATTFYRKHWWIKRFRGGGSSLFYVLKRMLPSLSHTSPSKTYNWSQVFKLTRKSADPEILHVQTG